MFDGNDENNVQGTSKSNQNAACATTSGDSTEHTLLDIDAITEKKMTNRIHKKIPFPSVGIRVSTALKDPNKRFVNADVTVYPAAWVGAGKII